MRKAVFLFLMLFSLPGYGASLQELAAAPAAYDGREVTVEGEVIGETLLSADGAWINLFDQGTTVGVFTEDRALLETITCYGSYAVQGDRVRVKGVFSLCCPQHGARDIHARELEVTVPGYMRTETIERRKIVVSIFLSIICLTLIALYFIKEQYGKRNKKTENKS